MRDRKKRTLMIGALCCLLVFMGIGYAVLSQVLNINGTATLEGTWKIRISNITVEEVFGGATNVDEKLTFTDTEATFGVNLSKPGDKIKYKVTVVNEGNIDAVLSINQTTIAHKDIKFTNTLNSGEILYGSSSANGTSKLSETEFYVTAEFSEYATSLATGESSEYKIELIYTQYDGNSFYEPPKDVETDNGVFKVASDGSILNYNVDLGEHVSVPAEVDGIPITKIDSNAFKDPQEEIVYNYDFKVILDSSENPVYAVIFNTDIIEELEQMAESYNIETYVVGDPKIPGVNTSAGEMEAYYYLETGLNEFWYEGKDDFLGETSVKTTGGNLKIKSLDLSNATNLEYIDDFAFSNANAETTNDELSSLPEGLTNLTFGDNNKEIKLGAGVFAGANLDMLKTYTTIRSGLTSAEVDSLVVENKYAFILPFIASSINTLIISPTDSQKEIATLVFGPDVTISQLPTYSNLKINNLYIEEGITKIPNTTFSATKLTNLSLPEGLKYIGKEAFYNTGLTSVVIPKSVNFIGHLSFASNPNLVITMKGRKNLDGIELGTDGLGSTYGQWKDESATVVFD